MGFVRGGRVGEIALGGAPEDSLFLKSNQKWSFSRKLSVKWLGNNLTPHVSLISKQFVFFLGQFNHIFKP